MESIFAGLFDSELTSVISLGDFLLCLGVSIVIGLIFAFSYSLGARYSKSFVTTLALLPAVVCVVIMMVNGNVGTGVAVAGAFSLVRFRSVPGNAREIVALFLAMGSGLIAGMGYLAFAVLFTVIMCLALLIFGRVNRNISADKRYKTLKITVPEDLNFTGVFEEVLEKYSSNTELIKIKTANFGSMFRLTYDLTLRPGVSEKNMLDELRERNGNLEITLSVRETDNSQL